MPSDIVLGAASFGTLGSVRSAIDALSFALDHGISAIDTSPSYGVDHLSEKIVGSVCGGVTGVRVFSKVLCPPLGSKDHGDAIVQSVEQSLARLRRDRLDIVFIESHPVDGWAEAVVSQLRPLVSGATIGEIGIFFHDDKPLTRQTLDFLQGELGTVPVEHPRNLLRRDEFYQDLQPEQVFATAPLAGGLLTGKYSAERTVPARFDQFPDLVMDGAFREADRLWRALGSLPGGLTGVALAWVLDQPALRGMVLGVRDARQLRDCLTSLATFRAALPELTASRGSL
ncbi:MAG: aldo/keto reductase [Paracoccaceae bacterium]